MAMKKRTSVCNSLDEKVNVGMRNFRYGRTPFRSRPGCGFKCPAVGEAAVAVGDALALGVPVAFAALSIASVWAGVFSPLNDGSCRNFKSHAGSTRAPSLLKRGGNKSLPSGV